MDKKKEKVIVIEVAEIDWYVIHKVREVREAKGVSQEQLSAKIGRALQFIGKVENQTSGAKYSLHHLNLIARALNVPFTDLLPRKATENDILKIKLRRKKVLNKDGSESKRTDTEVVSIEGMRE